MRLEVKKNGIKENCPATKTTFDKLDIIVNNQNFFKTNIINPSNKCLWQKKDSEFLAMLKINSKSKPLKKNELVEILKKYNLSNKKIQLISSRHKAKEKKRRKQKAIFIFNNISKLLEQSTHLDKNKEYLQYIHLLDEIKKYDNKLIENLIESIMAIKTNNHSWAKKSIQRIISTEPQRINFLMQPLYFKNEKEYQRFYDNFFMVAEYLIDNIKQEPILLKIFATYLDILINSKETKKLINKLGATWSLSQIRSIAKSKTHGYKYIFFWYKMLHNRSRDAEANSYIDSFISVKQIEKAGSSLLPLFIHYLPRDKKKRKTIINVIRRIINSTDNYQQYILLQLLKNKSIKQALLKRSSKFNKTIFQLERTFYRKMLKNADSMEFALYNLIRLGDVTDDMLWWIIL